MKTPYFVIHKEKLDENIDAFQQALNTVWPNSQLSYSVKTNSLPWLLEYLHTKNVFAEVVSDEEYMLAQKCGYRDNQIVFNGPIKGTKLLKSALEKGAIVNIDSKSDLMELQNTSNVFGENVGIRINPNPIIFKIEDIGYSDDGFRFGFSDESGELPNAIEIVKTKSESVGLHLHCNSVTRSRYVYVALAKYASKIIKKYNLDVSYVDMGGGFFGGVPGKTTPFEYISSIKEAFKEVIDINRTKLFVEPGSAIIGSVVDLVTSVIDIKDTLKSRIVTTDGSRIHIDPLWIKKSYMYSLETQKDNLYDKQIICGYTCMDHDRLMIIENQKELSIGDTIVYHRVGAYTMTFGGMFIRYYPEIYVDASEKYELVRNRISVDEYCAIHT